MAIVLDVRVAVVEVVHVVTMRHRGMPAPVRGCGRVLVHRMRFRMSPFTVDHSGNVRLAGLDTDACPPHC